MGKNEATTGQLAAVLGVSVRQVDRLADVGVLVRLRRGVFNLPASVQAFTRHREAEAVRLAGGDVGYAAPTSNGGSSDRQRSADRIGALARECDRALDRLRAEPDLERRRTLAQSGILGCLGALDNELQRSRALLPEAIRPLVKEHLDRISGRAIAEVLHLLDWALES